MDNVHACRPWALWAALALVANGCLADTEVPTQAKRPSPWTGFYVGADVGQARQTHAASCVAGTWNCQDIPITTPMQRAEGRTVGGHAGYNWHLASGYMWGVEGGVSGMDADATAIFPTVGQYKSSETQYGSLKTAQARVGWTFPVGLVYLSAGVAWGKVSTTFINRYDNGNIINDPNGYLLVRQTLRGSVLGVGMERALSDRWSVNVSYSRVKFRPYQFDVSTQINGGLAQGWAAVRVDPSLHLVKVGVNYRF